MYNPAQHHRRSIRLKGYDYSRAGMYFITMCVHNRQCLFGNISDGEMILNTYGQIAHDEWMKTPELRPHIELDAFVVMPNHIHGIIIIGEYGTDVSRRDVSHTSLLNTSQILMGEFDTSGWGESNSPRPAEFRSPSQNIGAIVRGYKSAVTKQIRNAGFSGIVWQRNYYEHIIRNEQAYQRIAEYITNNPLKWNNDKFCGNE